MEPIYAPQFADRRQAVRELVHYLRFYSPVPGTVIDISERGMMLESLTVLTPGSRHVFKFRRGPMLFSLEGTVQWTDYFRTLAETADRSIELYRSGVAFVEPIGVTSLEYLSRIC